MARPPRILVWLGWDHAVIYFVTLCVRDRRPVLASPEVFAAISEFCGTNENWNTLAAVTMPSHLHALVSPKVSREERITQFSAGLKRFVRKRCGGDWEWQQGVFDRLLRRGEFVGSKWNYIRDNPIRSGLARLWEEWLYLIALDETRAERPAA
jgi:REP element-mobilizing transposase RayT